MKISPINGEDMDKSIVARFYRQRCIIELGSIDTMLGTCFRKVGLKHGYDISPVFDD